MSKTWLDELKNSVIEDKQRLPEHSLLTALLYQAVSCAIRGDKQALFWLQEDHPSETTFTFGEVLDYLEIPPAMRKQVLNEIPKLQQNRKRIRYLRTVNNKGKLPS